jgi:hypothetical protein
VGMNDRGIVLRVCSIVWFKCTVFDTRSHCSPILSQCLKGAGDRGEDENVRVQRAPLHGGSLTPCCQVEYELDATATWA